MYLLIETKVKKRIPGHMSLITVALSFLLVSFPENIVFVPIVRLSGETGRSESERRGCVLMLCPLHIAIHSHHRFTGPHSYRVPLGDQVSWFPYRHPASSRPDGAVRCEMKEV